MISRDSELRIVNQLNTLAAGLEQMGVSATEVASQILRATAQLSDYERRGVLVKGEWKVMLVPKPDA